MKETNNHLGETVGVFKIIELMSYRDTDGHALYKGVCKKCGLEKVSRYNNFKETTKCTHIGIDGKVINYHVGWTNNRIRNLFHGMKQRCYNKNEKSYKWYGAKGIKICDEWLDNPLLFEKWSFNNGYNDNLTIDRINEDKDYSPDNCRWISNSDNAKYKSTTSVINVDGEEHTGKDWSKMLGLGINRINTYIREYGLDNTIEFIKRFRANPNLRHNNRNKSIYNVYMN